MRLGRGWRTRVVEAVSVDPIVPAKAGNSAQKLDVSTDQMPRHDDRPSLWSRSSGEVSLPYESGSKRTVIKGSSVSKAGAEAYWQKATPGGGIRATTVVP